MNRTFQLPEKDFFSIHEIAERWGCLVSDVWHYAGEGKKLRPVVLLSRLSKKYHIYALNVDRVFSLDGIELDDFEELPEYLYVRDFEHAEDVVCPSPCEKFCFSKFETFDGVRFMLVEAPSIGFRRHEAMLGEDAIKGRGLTPSLEGEDVDSIYQIFEFSFYLSQVVITKEERDRFEKECCSVANAEDEQLQAVSDNINNYKVLYEQQLEAVAEQNAEFREENDHLILANKKLEEENLVLRNNNEKLGKEPSTKSRNSYLRTIKSLSEALCDGLTGEPNKDAGLVLAALASKGVAAPIGDKALSNYLKDADEP